jgi:hypothetical protein
MGLGALNPFKPGSVYEQAAQGVSGGLAELDKGVNKAIPGGWLTVGAAAGAIYFAPEILAFAAEAGIAPEVAATELGVPGVNASGALVNPATGLAWEATGSGLAGNGAQLTAAEFAAQAGGGGLTASDVLTNASRLQKLANMVSPSGGKPNAQQFGQFQQANQPIQEQSGGLYRMNQNPFAQSQQPTSIQTPFGKTQDFLAQLAEEGKPMPTLADLVRTV